MSLLHEFRLDGLGAGGLVVKRPDQHRPFHPPPQDLEPLYPSLTRQQRWTSLDGLRVRAGRVEVKTRAIFNAAEWLFYKGLGEWQESPKFGCVVQP